MSRNINGARFELYAPSACNCSLPLIRLDVMHCDYNVCTTLPMIRSLAQLPAVPVGSTLTVCIANACSPCARLRID